MTGRDQPAILFEAVRSVSAETDLVPPLRDRGPNSLELKVFGR
jgi:hypothetical protein